LNAPHARRPYAAVPQLAAAMGRLIRTGGDNLSIFIDAEEQNRLEMSLSVLEATVRAHRPKNIGIAVQAYSRR